ncbi:hypothetical protein [Mycobacterium leprae]|nr:hypothetical protein [Mycobacterium leprae]
MGQLPILRERKKADTRRVFNATALDPTPQRGLANVTQDDIAIPAGVSRSNWRYPLISS